MIIATHTCKGNFKSTHMYEGGYEQVAKYFDRIPFDSYFLEYDDQRSGGFERIQEASQSLPLKQLALSLQCGFARTEEGNVLTEDEQWKRWLASYT